MISEERHLTVPEFAGRVNVPVQTIYKWNRTGTGPRFMRVGRYVRYRLSDVLAWETAQCVAWETAQCVGARRRGRARR